jgi:hypothetical protein
MSIISCTHTGTKVSFGQLANEICDENVTAIRLKDVVIEGDDGDFNGDMTFSRALRGHPYLEEFTLVNVSFADPNANLNLALSMIFVTVPAITTVHIENTKVPMSALMGLEYCASLKKLVLARNQLDDKDAATVASYISRGSGGSTTSSVQELDLSENNMTEEGCASFKKNVSLHCLKLNGNKEASVGIIMDRDIEGKVHKRSAMAA